MDTGLHRRAGTLASGPFSVLLTAREAGWAYSALRVLELGPGGEALVPGLFAPPDPIAAPYPSESSRHV